MEPGASGSFWEGISSKLFYEENRCKRWFHPQQGQKGGYEPSITLTPPQKEVSAQGPVPVPKLGFCFSEDDSSLNSSLLSLPQVLLIFIPGMELNCLKDDMSSPARALLEDEF